MPSMSERSRWKHQGRITAQLSGITRLPSGELAPQQTKVACWEPTVEANSRLLWESFLRKWVTRQKTKVNPNFIDSGAIRSWTTFGTAIFVLCTSAKSTNTYYKDKEVWIFLRAVYNDRSTGNLKVGNSTVFRPVTELGGFITSGTAPFWSTWCFKVPHVNLFLSFRRTFGVLRGRKAGKLVCHKFFGFRNFTAPLESSKRNKRTSIF